jgi:hypothetical protein
METKYINILIGVCGSGFIALFIWWVILLTQKKERFLEMEKKQDRNESNERYEILPESLYENQNASSPYPPEPMIPFQVYQPQNINVDIIEITCEDESKTETNENFEIDILEIQSQPVSQQINQPVIQQINQPVIQQINQPRNQSTFCTCGGLIHQTCASPAQRVNNYNKGLTEFAKLPNKGWQDVMPYDQWTEQPNYYKQNTNWFDVMPYDIYQSS